MNDTSHSQTNTITPHFLITSIKRRVRYQPMRQVANIALRSGSASNALALRTAIQQVAAQPTPDGIRGLFSHPNLIPQQAADLWEIAAKNKLINDTPLCLAYLGYQSHRGDADSVKRAMDLMATRGIVHTEKTYDMLIRAYINVKNTVGVLKSYFQLAQANVDTTEHGIQTSILTYFARNPHYIELVELFLALTSTNPKPQYNVLYHSVINELIKSGTDIRNVQKINTLLREMDTLRILPLPATFEILLHTDAIDFEIAVQLFAKMRKHRIVTVYAYAGMIQRNGQQGRLKECMRLWSELLAHNITPTPAAYLAIMQPLAQRGKAREVTKLINDMASRGVRVSLLAYTVQAQAFLVEGSLGRAVAVLDDMLVHRVKPDEKLFGILVRAYMDADELKTSVELVERAYAANVEAGALLAILVSAFGDPESQEAHDELMKKLEEKKIEITQEMHDAIARRRRSVPFPPGSPPFSYRQPRPNQHSSFEPPLTHTAEPSIPLHSSSQHIPLQPTQAPLSHPPLPFPHYPQQYPVQYPYQYQPIFVQYDPTQPPYQYPYHQAPFQPPPANNPPTNLPPTNFPPANLPPTNLPPTNLPPTSSPPTNASSNPPSSSSNPTEPPNQSPSATEQQTQSPNQVENTAQPSTQESSQNFDAPQTSPFLSPPTPVPPPTENTPHPSLPPTSTHPPPIYAYSPPPSSSLPLVHPSQSYSSLPDPYRPIHSQFTQNTFPNSTKFNSNFQKASNNSNEPNLETNRPQTKRAIAQRLQRRNERQQSKIEKLQSRHEINNFIIEKLAQPLPSPSALSPTPSPPSTSTSPSLSLPEGQMSPEEYKRELENMVKTIQQKLDSFKAFENNSSKNSENTTNTNNTNNTITENTNKNEESANTETTTNDKNNQIEHGKKEETTESEKEKLHAQMQEHG